MKCLKRCMLLVALSLSAAPLEARELLIVLDASNSMWGQIDGEAKITIARAALSGLIDELDNEDQVGLIAYGHRREGDCQDVELIRPLSKLDAAALKQQINAINPKGKTPITHAMEAAFAAIGDSGSNIILVSDGVETCGADPCAAVKAVKDGGLVFNLQVIGFDVDAQAREQLACMAEAGGGRLWTAADSDELVQAMEQAGGVQTSAGAVASITGQANIERQGETLQQVQRDDEVFREDELRTAAGARLNVALVDGSHIELDEGSLLAIQEYILDPAADSAMYLRLGRLRLTVSSTFSSRRGSFRVTTPNAAVGVQGTIFSILFMNNTTEVFVEEGQVAVRNSDPAVTDEVVLGPGEFTRVIADRPPEPISTPELTVNVNLNGAPVTAKVSITDRGREAASGSAPLVHSLHPGDYLITATLDDGYSQTDEIKLPPDGLTYTVEITRVPPLAPVSISARQPGDLPSQGDLQWMIINKITEEMLVPVEQSFEISTNLAPGSYDVLVASDDYEGEVAIEVQASGTNQFVVELKARAVENGFFSPETVPAGELMSFEWKGPAAEKDRIFIAGLDMAENRYKTSNVHRVSDGSPAVMVAPALPGAYEVRYFSGANGAVVFRKALEVTAAEVRITAPGELIAGTEFTFDWQGPSAEGDRLFLAKPEMDASKYYTDSDVSHMVTAGSSANLIAPVNAGDYEIRYYSRANGRPLVRTPIRVMAHTVKIDAPRTVSPGAEFEFSWQGPNAKGDFLFIAEPEMKENRYYIGSGHATKNGPSGKFTAPTDQGAYEIRYFSKRNGAMLAKRVFMVR